MRTINVDSKIVEVRKMKVLLDSDVAALYGVETKRINEAVKNNIDKFPKGYIISLNSKEIKDLRSKISTANNNSKTRVLPKAFTEKGLYMLATILKSPKATQTTLAIIETFAKIRELTRTVGELSKTTTKEEKQPLMQKSGEIMADILGDSLNISETETSFEINLAVMNIKHTVKRK
ncbi:MAG: ORF6N domain-containing protein [Treponema sp.]|nr:ORF6N domain-containing protein [Treponema sp.]